MPNVETTTTEKPFTLNDVPRKEFDTTIPTEQDEALKLMTAITQNVPEKLIVTNYTDWSNGIPAGYRVYIAPIMERKEVSGSDKKKEVPVAVFMGLIPSFDLLLETETGRAYAAAGVRSALATKLMNSIRNAKTGQSLPFSVASFIESTRTTEDLSTFNAYSDLAIAYFRKKNVTAMTAKLLRQCMQSSAFCKAQFNDVVDKAVEQCLINIITMATKANKPTAVLDNWLATRHNVAADIPAELDFDDIDSMLEEGPAADAA